ncbi:MAG: glycoside hydrolase family 16 protein [Akkermansiaceae bacterium]|nr:glycoside hydrolase family 16 protein [Akkermansiaceae bacterium]
MKSGAFFPRLAKALAAGLFALWGAAASGQEREGWRLTFSDEFDKDFLDLRKWAPRDPWGAEKNGELQAYIPKAYELADGVLRIRADRARAFYDDKVRDYTSGILITSGKFSQRFGRFEIRCRVPKGRGLWPAFWMLPEPPSWPPEIDVMEILGREPDRVYLTHHWPDPKNPGEKAISDAGEWRGPDFSADFHTFAVEWEAAEIRWYVDDVERRRSRKNIPRVPMFLLVNLALGGDWAKAPDASTPFPAYFDIDWVRVWEKTGP